MTTQQEDDDSVTVAAAVDDSAALGWAGDEADAAVSVLSVDEQPTIESAAPAGQVTELEPVVEPEPTAATDATLARELLIESNPNPLEVQTDSGKREAFSNGTLVLVGLLAGIYLLYAIGWFIGGGRIEPATETLLDRVGFVVAFWLSVALPILWFATSMLATKKTWSRITALLIGLVLCIPWPFIVVGAWGV